MPRVRATSNDGQRTTGYMFFCPGCNQYHGVTVVPPVVWNFNGDIEKPTFSPSILVRGKREITEEERQRILAHEKLDIPDMCCHSFVTDGRIRFLGDCTHALAGQTVDLPEIE
jgi:hypothetical protein